MIHREGSIGEAIYSDCMKYRYMLRRCWNQLFVPPRYVAWVLLNPSTATEDQDDSTIRRCIGYSQEWGFDGLYILNIFALRSTDPRALYKTRDPIGPDNDRMIEKYALACSSVVAGWGVHGLFKQRGETVLRRLTIEIGVDVSCLRVTKDGTPNHPLYLKGDLKPVQLRAKEVKL